MRCARLRPHSDTRQSPRTVLRQPIRAICWKTKNARAQREEPIARAWPRYNRLNGPNQQGNTNRPEAIQKMTKNSFGARTALEVSGKTFTIHALAALTKRGFNLERLPFSIKVLLENVLRRE